MPTATGLAVSAVLPGDEPAWSEAMALYQASIEPAEQRAPARLAEDLHAGRERLFVGQDAAGRVRAFTVIASLPDGTALMDYLAVEAGQRGGGVGSAFVKQVLAGLSAPRLLIEVDDPDHAADPETCRARARFYERLGARKLPGVRHLLPSSLGGPPVVMGIYALPLRDAGGVVPGETLAGMWRFIYQDLYDRPLLEQALAGLPAQIAFAE